MHDQSAAHLRQAFLDYFRKHGHTAVKSAPLVPAGDNSLMFVNAGMVPFKDVFVGAESRPYKRATSVQKCMRVSGKHNDLEEVGRTARHHTLFEMMGNFSFGDYFKEEAIAYAWNFIHKELGLNADKLWITVFGGADGIAADAEARALWRKISGLPDARILDMGMKDNFWSMGDTGACGPCTEIHYDQGEGPVGPKDFDSGRVMEIWNNVFMQFDRQPGGKLVNLPAPSVDTGMGLERVVALVQGHNTNYHSDLFMPLLDTVAELAQKPYKGGPSEDDVSMRVIADHARAAAFLIADGIQPSNEGRGYVLRRIMRRAIRHGRRLGLTDLFMAQVSDQVVRIMGEAYPELPEAQSLMNKVIDLEETGFRRTLDTGLDILSTALSAAKSTPKKDASQKPVLAGETIFRLYDTYGFPKDLTEVIAEEAGVGVDEAGFVASMQEQKTRSRGAGAKEAGPQSAYKQLLLNNGPTTFIGYPHEDLPPNKRKESWRLSPDAGQFLEAQCRIVAIVQDGAPVERVDAGQSVLNVEVVLEPTPFYGESGGQVGDAGRLTDATGIEGGLEAEVTDTQKPLSDMTVQHVALRRGSLTVGQSVWAGYAPEPRRNTREHHSATHLLHGSLRRVLGAHVKQAGSRVGPDHLRFDFTHFSSMTTEELLAVEADANRQIDAAAPVTIAELSFDEAKQSGAIALFGEKYGERVRVLTMGESVELCGGTHAQNTKELGLLLVGREEAVQSGVRRIEAKVGTAAQKALAQMATSLRDAGQALSGALTPAAGHTVDGAIAAIARLRAHYDQSRNTLKGHEPKPEVFTAHSSEATKTHLPDIEPVQTLAEAQSRRRSWQRLVTLTNSKPADVEALVQSWQTEGEVALVITDLAQLIAVNRHNDKLLESQASLGVAQVAQNLVSQAKKVGGVTLLCAQVDASGGALRTLADHLKAELASAIICLGNNTEGKATLLVMVTADLTKRFQAGKLVGQLAPCIAGRGGGKPEFAQAGGQDPSGLPKAFAQLEALLTKG